MIVYLKVLTFLADVLLFLFELTELLLGYAELLLDLLLPGFHHPHTFSQDSDHLVTLLQLICTKIISLRLELKQSQKNNCNGR